MAGPHAQKRRREDAKRKGSLPTPRKKIKKQREYHSSSEDDDDAGQDFKAVNLLDSDDNDDIHNAAADDGASSGSEAQLEEESGGDDSDEDSDDGDGGEEEEEEEEEEEGSSGSKKNPNMIAKSKRNDPSAFATSMTKILHTKLSSARRSDPVLSRSADAAKAARDAEESALESRARRKLREQKKQAKEKGRVRDVMVGVVDELTGEPEATISEILADEKRLKKVATRGVVKMFNAIRQAQTGAAQAERQNKKKHVIGQGARDDKVAEMSKEAFLDLIAKGGGGLSKKPLQEA